MKENKRERKRIKVTLRKFLVTTSFLLILTLSQVQSAHAFSGQDVRNFFGSVANVVFQGKAPVDNTIAIASPNQAPAKAVAGISIDTDTFNALQKRVGSLELQFGSSTAQATPQNVLVIDTAGGNLLRNSSFEAGGTGSIPSQWNAQLDSNSGNTFISQEGIHSGSYGLKFLGGGTGNFGLSQPNTKTTPQRTYTLSAWVKFTNAPSANFRIGFWDEQNNKEGSFKNIRVSGTKDWFRVSTTVTTPGFITDSKNYFPMFEVQGLTSGAVYLDDVQLTEGSVLTSYNSAQANAGTSSTALGDGAILGSTGGDLYPAQSGTGQLGTSNNKWSALNLNKATIDSNGNLNLSGGLTIGALGSGILHSNGSGSITSSATNLASSDVTGTLPVGNGGTGQTSFTVNGVVYGNGSNGLSVLTPGTSGYVLQSNGTGSAPSWVPAGSGGGSAFSAITAGTNTSAAMVVGTGASLTTSGTGTINANQLNGQTTSVGGALTTAAAFTTSGANALTLTTTGATNVTLPTSGTLSTFGGGFNNLTAGTNTTAAMVLGTGSSLSFSGSGTNNANQLNGQTTSVGGALTTAAAFTTSGANALTLTTTGATNVTLPTSGTLSTFGGSFTNLTAGTNTTAALVVGTGASLGGTGTGTITATGADSNAAAGTVNIGNTNAGAIALGNGTQNTTLTLTGTGLTSLGGNLTFSGSAARTITGPGAGGLTLSDTTGAITITGGANSTWDLGTGNTLSLQTTNNGPITTGTGLLTQGGNVTFSGVAARTITGPNTGAAGGLVLTTPNATAANSSGLTINTGTTTTSGTVGNILIQTGNSAGAAGAITIDTGTGTSPTVNVGNTNATTLALGNASAATSITGNRWSVTSAGAQTLSPTAASTTALTVNGTTNATPSDAMDINLLHTGGTATNGLQVNVNATGATTNAVNITQTAGTVTNALRFIGTFASNLISAPNLTVTNGGAFTAGTYNNITIGSTIQPSAAGAIALQSNGVNTVTVDTGAAGSTVNIGNTNAGAIALGNGTQNTTLTLTGTGLTTLGGNLTFSGAAARTITGPNTGAAGALTLTTTGNLSGLAFNTANATSGNSGAISLTSGTVTTSGTSGNVTINTGNSATATLNTGGITIQSGNITTSGTSGNVALEAGTGGTLGTIQLGVASNAPITTGTGLVTAGGNVTFSGVAARTITGPNTGAAGGLVLTTPNATAANSSGLTINTGTTTTSGTVGSILIQTGNSAGAAGAITIDTGTGTTPTVNIGNTNATSLVLGNAATAITLNGNTSLASGKTLQVQGNTTFGPATTHLISSQTTLPTESVVTFTAGTVAAGSTDTKGQFTVTTTAGTGSVTLLFTASYGAAPTCVVTPASANTQADASKIYVTTAISGLTVNYNVAPTANLQTWNYFCMQ